MHKEQHNLYIYNSLTKQKEQFVPINSPNVGIYVCGMTVYDYWHIGNARVFIFFDVVVRYLQVIGYKVNYVRNITDIDDKIIRRAAETKRGWKELTAFFIDVLHEDEKLLGDIKPTLEPKVSENIDVIIEMIKVLLDKKYAYLASNGDVYFDVNKFTGYGKLAHQDLKGLRSGARVEISAVKKDPLDFALWKMAKPGEPSWTSPWGEGRPGWHIECSAMAAKYLGKHFDIHGGGADLQFPHHQNELAQSEATYGCKFVNYWMHAGFVQVDSAKMSKSLGIFFTVREVLKKYHPEVIRFFILSSHYRSPLNYTEDNLNSAKNGLARLYTSLQNIEQKDVFELESISEENPVFYVEYVKPFFDAMNDDFNTSEAIAAIFNLSHLSNARKDLQESDLWLYAAIMRYFGAILGILQHEPKEFLQFGIESFDQEQIQKFIQQRNEARKNKNWQEADRIRQMLLEKGIILEDTAKGTIWKSNF